MFVLVNSFNCRVWDQDQFSKDDIIGNMFLDLNNVLIYKESSEITGWFPVYDTFRGMLFSTIVFPRFTIASVAPALAGSLCCVASSVYVFFRDSASTYIFSPVGIRGELKISVKIEFFGQLNTGTENPTGVVFLSGL